jgi:hypothetical protein
MDSKSRKSNGATSEGVPKVIGTRPKELIPLLERWRAAHAGVPWSFLIDKALRVELKPYARKRDSLTSKPEDGR